MFYPTHSRHRRGTTLLEMVTAGAIGTVMVAGAFAMFTSMGSLQERADRKLEALAELGIASQRQVRMMENAGANLKAARLAVRVNRNLTSIDYWDSNTSAMVSLLPVSRDPTDAGADLQGFLQSSDVVDILEGYDSTVRKAGRMVGVNQATGVATLNDWSPLATEQQLRDGGYTPPANLAVAFAPPYEWPKFVVAAGLSNGQQSSCLLKVTGVPGSPTLMQVTLEHVLVGYGTRGGPFFYTAAEGPSAPTFATTNFSALASSVASVTGMPGATCPSDGMSVYGVSRRTLYAVARLRTGDRPALFEFAYDFENDRFQDPVPLSIGVDDMAVQPLAVCGTDVCAVADGGAAATDFPYTDATNVGASSVVALMVRLVSKGMSDNKQASHDDAGIWFADGTAPIDGLRRDARETRISLMNLNPQMVPQD